MKKIRIEFKWAIIFAVVALVWMILEKLVGLHDVYIEKHAIYTNFFAIPAILIYYLALVDKRKNYYQGTMSYKQGFITGLIITVIVALLSPLTQYITSTFITPDYFANIIEYSVDSGRMSLEQAEGYFNLKSYITQSMIGALVMGLITSAVVAIFTRTKGA